jgi:hypothetical protein
MLEIALMACSMVGATGERAQAAHWDAQMDAVIRYYKSWPRPVESGPGIRFVPVYVSPAMQWAVPNSALYGPPYGPGSGPVAPFPKYGEVPPTSS